MVINCKICIRTIKRRKRLNKTKMKYLVAYKLKHVVPKKNVPVYKLYIFMFFNDFFFLFVPWLYVFRLDPLIYFLLLLPPTTSSCGSPVWCRLKTATVRTQNGQFTSPIQCSTLKFLLLILHSDIALPFMPSYVWLSFTAVCISGRLQAVIWDQRWAEGSDAGSQCEAHQDRAAEITDTPLWRCTCPSTSQHSQQ